MPHETRHNGLETLAAETKQESQPPALKYENPVVFEHLKKGGKLSFREFVSISLLLFKRESSIHLLSKS